MERSTGAVTATPDKMMKADGPPLIAVGDKIFWTGGGNGEVAIGMEPVASARLELRVRRARCLRIGHAQSPPWQPD